MSGINVQVWLKVATGGRWSVTELNEALPQLPAKAVDGSARQLAAAGMLDLHHGDAGLSFGITRDCTVPRGITVAQVLQAVTGEGGAP